MKRNDLRALRELSLTELQQRARETKEELFNLRFSLRTGHLSDFSRVKLVRRTYAQIQTAISEKKIAVLRQAQNDRQSQDRHGAA
ncbi:MAG TPA: 50S ribosomal protein L29 [Candidatus Elarobacter sp.]|nr:50S ribosomal protein L29 [Candidatus Elarobacter sp.]